MPSKTASKSTPKRKTTSTPPPAPELVAVPAIKHTPTHADIAFRAWELSQLRTHSEGSELNDWLAAERELRAS